VAVEERLREGEQREDREELRRPRRDADGGGAQRALVVERLANGDDHGEDHPDLRESEHRGAERREDPERLSDARRGGEAEDAQELAAVDACPRLGREAAPDPETKHRPEQPSEDGDGAIRAMRMALKKANVAPSQVAYINAHGTSTPYNDRLETLAIKACFGEHAYKLAISSTSR
jgi:hypothetical protein